MVGGTWIEHVTSSVSRKRSPTELTARVSQSARTAEPSESMAPTLLRSTVRFSLNRARFGFDKPLRCMIEFRVLLDL
jgi:hypothetical protein